MKNNVTFEMLLEQLARIEKLIKELNEDRLTD
mgnify:CR=1 FL=1